MKTVHLARSAALTTYEAGQITDPWITLAVIDCILDLVPPNVVQCSWPSEKSTSQLYTASGIWSCAVLSKRVAWRMVSGSVADGVRCFTENQCKCNDIWVVGQKISYCLQKWDKVSCGGTSGAKSIWITQVKRRRWYQKCRVQNWAAVVYYTVIWKC